MLRGYRNMIKEWFPATSSRGALRCALLFAVLAGWAIGVEAAQPGIVSVTHGDVDLTIPPNVPAEQVWHYGLGLPIQLDATTGGLLVNIRRGETYTDNEVGTDLIKFNSLDGISASGAVAVSRSSEPDTAKYPMFGGFVPLGARFADGSAHPHGGTGFGINVVGFFPKPVEYCMEMAQFHYDGSNFTVDQTVRYEHLNVGDSGWEINNIGLSAAIPNGNDLLYGAVCSNSTYTNVSGIVTFQHGTDGWQPASFAPVTDLGASWSEPSLVRDVDGSLLLSARDRNSSIALWGSADGSEWNQLINLPDARSIAPVSLNQAVDGSPYLVTSLSPPAISDQNDRELLQIAPINSDHDGLESAIVVRDGNEEFGGPPSSGYPWYIDHGISNVIRLSDGEWHNILVYRVLDRGEHFGEPATAYTGCYVEEVFSSGDPCPMGLVFVPEPSALILNTTGMLVLAGYWCYRRRARKIRLPSRVGEKPSTSAAKASPRTPWPSCCENLAGCIHLVVPRKNNQGDTLGWENAGPSAR